ncbi:MAG TPA: alpha/beta fold hydrolase [Anaerolineales bacterium]|nr:alpha/beta fold hydrolase [Anaerolineales bacterium]
MPIQEVNSRQKIYYIDENQTAKPVVLLIHGLGAISSSWALQVPDLVKAGFRVVAPDVHGFGQSPYTGGLHSVRQMTNDITRLLEQLQIVSACVVGISMGGALALQIALDRPHQIDRLVLVNTFASLRPKNFAVRAYFVYRFLVVCILGLSSQAQVVARRVFPHPEQEELRQVFYSQIMQADARGYRAAMLALAFFDVKKRLPEIKAPTLVITGQEDTTVPPDTQMVLAKGIQNAQHMIIPGAGHAVIVEKHQLFNQVLLKFLLSGKTDRF